MSEAAITYSDLYDKLFAQASYALRNHNPCKWENGKCVAMRNPEESYMPDGCCTGPRCEHLTDKGCGVESLGCKVWLCSYVRYKPENALVVNTLDTLLNVARNPLNINPYSRDSKVQTLAYLRKV